jgi:hypothetical protein
MASSSRLKPGEAGSIDFTVDVRGKSGPLTKTMIVYTNDPVKPAVMLTIRAKVTSGPTASGGAGQK